METHHGTRVSFSIYIFLSLLHLSIVSAFSPIDHYLIDCGSTKQPTVDADNRRFTGDSSELGSRFLKSTQTISLRDANPSPFSSPIYHTARVFKRPSKYAFMIKGRGTHLVRLHFNPFYSSNFNMYDSHFHVFANGYLLLNNFTVVKSPLPEIKDYMIWIDNEEMVITFVPLKKSMIAFVNAIEVISAPKDLVADVATLVTSERIFRISGLMRNAFETVYRANVGGPKVTPFNDSLWRSWVPDDKFLKLHDGSQMVYFSGRIKYQIGGASREVGPANMYNSARVISSLDDLIPHLNISWEFPVTGEYRYLVRLHFCDIASMSLYLLYFNVYVNGNLAYENLDLSSLTNMCLASPFYADFVVNMESGGIISVAVGPSSLSMPHAIDAILNGIEIMKMNNSMGSLDGDVCPDSDLKSWPKRNVGDVVPWASAVCLFGAALMFMCRRWVGINFGAWSPIPVYISEVNLKTGTQPSFG